MRSTYKKLGPHIRELKVKNSDGACSDLRGVSIGKAFMPSVANIHGTDLSKYKRVKKHQFAFNPMHVGRDEVLPIALLTEDAQIIVSPAYVVFEVLDQEVLLPEYLMMWCRRPEFDRNAWFTTDSSVRGGFSWDNFSDMELPIPSIEQQREIVNEYRTVVDRIRLNRRLNEKLEEAAQAIYRQWFSEFEFPMTTEYARSIGKPELAGQPYKSSGGEMEYNEVLEQEIPKGWRDGDWGVLGTLFTGFAFPGEDYAENGGLTVVRGENVSEQFLRWDVRKTWPHPIPDRASHCGLQELDILIGMDGSKVGKNWTLVSKFELPLILAQRVACVRGRKEFYQYFLYYSMFPDRFSIYVHQVHTGTSVPHISGQQILEYPVVVPPDGILELFADLVRQPTLLRQKYQRESKVCEKLREVLLSRIAQQDLHEIH
jgi:type I restriction enzyme, S subunit